MASRNTPGTTASNMTKAQRREHARQLARQLQEEELRRAKRNRLYTAIGVVVVLAFLTAIVVFIVKSGKKNDEIEVVEKSPFANVADNGAISIGSKDGAPAAGVVNEGAPVVTVYSDYLCTHCNDFDSEYGVQLVEMAAKGEITLEKVPVATQGYDFSFASAQADMYIAANAPELYTTYHERVIQDVTDPVFDNRQPEPEYTALVDVAKSVGVPDDVVVGLEEVLKEDAHRGFINNVNQAFREVPDAHGTPSIFLDGKYIENWTTIVTEAKAAAVKAGTASEE